MKPRIEILYQPGMKLFCKIYPWLGKHILSRLDPEFVHETSILILQHWPQIRFHISRPDRPEQKYTIIAKIVSQNLNVCINKSVFTSPDRLFDETKELRQELIKSGWQGNMIFGFREEMN